MKITVLSGSPKGENSVTLQYVNFIKNKFSQYEFIVHDVSLRIKKLEKNVLAFSEILNDVRISDGIIWAFPVYYLLVPSQYKRFIELISENNNEEVFANKYCVAISTSIHFNDHTAHKYVNAVCDDLNMKYVGSYSAHMSDLMNVEQRKQLLMFANDFFDSVENQVHISKSYQQLRWREFEYVPNKSRPDVDVKNKKLLIVTDAKQHQKNLLNMIEKFKFSFVQDVKVLNLNDLNIKGGCLGCLECGYDNHCRYTEKDNYLNFYNTQIKTADILIWAAEIKDRYLSSTWKMFFDRSFYNGHTPTLTGKQIGFIISGPLSQNQNLKEALESWIEIQPANIAGFVTDEFGSSDDIDNLLHELAARSVHHALCDYKKPAMFLGVAGQKLFRDEIWGRFRYVFMSDHKNYKSLGLYDFPQKDIKTRIKNFIFTSLLKLSTVRKEFTKRIKTETVKPYRTIAGLNS